MSRHSKHSNDRMFFTAKERADAGYSKTRKDCVALAVAVKGQSSSRAINSLLRRFAALQIAGGIHPLLAWVESELNPVDEPSRRHAA
eukprot:Skav220245  [mRNA]  locus=scaffold3452:121652:123410:- [translate_table: standard]